MSFLRQWLQKSHPGTFFMGGAFCCTSEIKELRIKTLEGPRNKRVGDGLELDIGQVLTRRCLHSRVFSHQETQQVPTEEVSLEVLLSNGQKVLVNVLTSDQTEDVLEVRHLYLPCTPGSQVWG